MRGIRVSKAARKDFDLIIVAARYQAEDGLLDIAQTYARRGPIWGDVELLERVQIVELIKSGRRIVTGSLAELQGDFDVVGTLNLVAKNGSERLVVGEGTPQEDELQIPLF